MKTAQSASSLISNVSRHIAGRFRSQFTIALLAAWIVGGCGPFTVCHASAADPSSNYAPLFAKAGSPSAQSGRSTLGSDFDWAATATTLGDARERWQMFLAQHDPADGSFEDNFHALRVTAARYELARIFYLLGDAASGDAHLRRADPLDLR
jgi:hypothetical protein